jgi:hypothetical protein
MQNNRFVVLTGHLGNYPLSDLVGILRYQRKSGRLLIEYPKGPATFFFQDGQLVDARLLGLTGLQAICVALAEPDAAFNFNPLIQASHRSIDQSMERVVAELLGCWDESAIQIESTATVAVGDGSSPSHATETASLPARREPLALPPARFIVIRQRSLLLVAAAIFIVLGLSTVIAVTGGFKRALTLASSPARDDLKPPVAQNAAPSGLTHPEKVNRLAGMTDAVRSNRLSPATEHHQENRASLRKQSTDDLSEPAGAKAASQEAVPSAEPKKPAEGPKVGPQAINVVMQVENGRVVKASIAQHEPGMANYEALALRIARQRRYATKLNGGETVTINIKQPQ